MDGFLGQIIYFGGSFAPRNWSFCEGQPVQISQYTSLYAVLTTTFGGDGRSYFNLPDTRGRFTLSSGASSVDPYNFAEGVSGGTTKLTLTPEQIPAHTHEAALVVSSAIGNQTSPPADGAIHFSPPSGPASATIYGPAPSENEMVSLNSASITLSSTGSGSAFSILPPFVSIPSVICTSGLFPSRN